MSNKINEIFYSLQGEGSLTGRAAAFVRFSGCNRRCSFCDANFASFQELSGNEILAALLDVDPILATNETALIVFTGGEPTLQLTREFLEDVREAFPGATIQVETNGSTLDRWNGFDLCRLAISPKTPEDARLAIRFLSDNPDVQAELKIVYDGDDLSIFDGVRSDVAKFIQPKFVDGDDIATRVNIEKSISFIKENPQWTLSLQTHKIVGIR